ncbi:MAG: TfoX/Sxy family protein [Deltaproteobacteria bacterium]|nr:TfoX/Sxy family protein [Deltaproteobacteria bacterium]
MRDASFVTHVMDLLEPVGPTRARAMMGGHIVFCCELAVALIADERLYLKVDETSKQAFARAGGEPFVYEQRGKSIEMSYWTPPQSTLDSPEEMREWALLAVEAAARSKRPKPKKKAARTAPRRDAASSKKGNTRAGSRGSARRASR